MISHQHLLRVGQNYGVGGKGKLIILAWVPQVTEACAAALLRAGTPGSRSEEGKVGETIQGRGTQQSILWAGSSSESLQKLTASQSSPPREEEGECIYLHWFSSAQMQWFPSTTRLPMSGHQVGPHKVWPSASPCNPQGRRHKAHSVGIRPGPLDCAHMMLV